MNDQVKTNTAQSDEDEIDLLELLHTLLDGKWLIISISVLSLVLAFVYAFGQQPIFKADALLQVEAQKQGIPGLEDIAGLGGDDASVGTELEVIKSRTILVQTIKDLKLDVTAHPKRVPILGNFYKHLFNSDSLNKPFGLFNSYAWGNEKIQINRLEVEKELLNKPLTLVSTGEGNLRLQITTGLYYQAKLVALRLPKITV